MLYNCFCVKCAIMLCLFSKTLSFNKWIFEPAEPLSFKEFESASKLKVPDDVYHRGFQDEFSEDDIIKLNLQDRSIFSVERHFWPNGEVPYVLDKEYDEKGRILIARAFQEFQNKTCIRFLPRRNEKDYLQITYNKGCSSHVGRIGDAQTLVLGRGCYSLGIIMHELMHALGFIHEQSRIDRDLYVTIMWGNIQNGREDNFRTYNWYSKRLLKEKYDYSSILHYQQYAFSKDPENKPTINPKRTNIHIGQRKELSEGDIRKVNSAYSCSSKKTE